MKSFSVLCFLFLLIPQMGFAYAPESTHAALTALILDLYSKTHPPLSSEERAWVIQGSLDEDTIPRWVNHFYDPIHDAGWSGGGLGSLPSSTTLFLSSVLLSTFPPQSAVSWAVSSSLQKSYALYGGDMSWEHGLFSYASGNQEEAYRALGHTLHILEDLTVPEHTRDDTHADGLEFVTGDYGSPYEDYVSRYAPDTISKTDILVRAMRFSSTSSEDLPTMLRRIALSTNTFFFSKDTIMSPAYALPRVVRQDADYAYGKDSDGSEFPLAGIVKRYDPVTQTFVPTFEIGRSPKMDRVHEAYFSRLGASAVRSGSELIVRFLSEADDTAEVQQGLFSRIRSALTPQTFSLYGLVASAKDALQGFLGMGKESSPTTLLPVPSSSTPVLPSSSRTVTVSPSTQTKKSSGSQASSSSPSSSPSPVLVPAKPRPSSSFALPVSPSSSPASPSIVSSTPLVVSSPASSSSSASSPSSLGGTSGTPSFILDTRTLLIHEIQTGWTDEPGDEFVELFNPQDESVSLEGWSLQYLSGGAASFSSLKKKNFLPELKIPAHGYVLVARGLDGSGEDGYRGSVLPDMTERGLGMSGADTGGTLFLVQSTDLIASASDSSIADRVGWGTGTVYPEGRAAVSPGKAESITRRCDVRNPCDTGDNQADFFLTTTPSPRNLAGAGTDLFTPPLPVSSSSTPSSTASSSLLSLQYLAKEGVIHVTWETEDSRGSRVSLDCGSCGMPSSSRTVFAGTSTSIPVFVSGVSYNVSLVQGSTTMTDTISVPSLFSRTVFSQGADGSYFLDLFYPTRPFLPSEAPWQGIVAYGDRAPNTENIVLTTQGFHRPSDESGVIPLQIPGKSPYPSFIFATDPAYATGIGGGLSNSAAFLPEEDGHLRLFLGSDLPASFLTLAFYELTHAGGGTQDLSLRMIEPTAIPFDPSPLFASPTMPPAPEFSFNREQKMLSLSWDGSTDRDTPDDSLRYAIRVGNDPWEDLGDRLYALRITDSTPLSFSLRARDEFGNLSPLREASWTPPDDVIFSYDQLDHDVLLGSVESGMQSLRFPAPFTISSIALWIGNNGGPYCCTKTHLDILEEGNTESLLSSDTQVTSRNVPQEERIYTFPEPFSFAPDVRYFLRVVNDGGTANTASFYGSDANPFLYGFWNDGGSDLFMRFVQPFPSGV